MSNDLTMCTGGECPEKQNCLRSTKAKYGRVDFFGIVPYNFTNKSCEYFISNRPDVEKIRFRAYQIWQNNPSESDFKNWLKAESELIEKLNE